MTTTALCRGAFRRHVVPLTLSLSSGLYLVSRQQPMRLDAAAVARPVSPSISRDFVAENEGWINHEFVKQLSGGSLTGFLAGLLVSVFSKTLVLLTGLAIVAIQVASKNGVDLLEMLRLRQRINSSKILSALDKNPAFKVAFGTTFALSAFMQF